MCCLDIKGQIWLITHCKQLMSLCTNVFFVSSQWRNSNTRTDKYSQSFSPAFALTWLYIKESQMNMWSTEVPIGSSFCYQAIVSSAIPFSSDSLKTVILALLKTNGPIHWHLCLVFAWVSVLYSVLMSCNSVPRHTVLSEVAFSHLSSHGNACSTEVLFGVGFRVWNQWHFLTICDRVWF